MPDPYNRGLIEKVSFAIEGTAWKNEDGSGGIFKTTIHNVDSGDMVGSSILDIDSNFINACIPPNFKAMQKTERAYAQRSIQTAPRKALTSRKLTVDVWTNQASPQSIYHEGEDVTIHCEVNEPAYIRLVYVPRRW